MKIQLKMLALAAIAFLSINVACSDDDDNPNDGITATTDVTDLIDPAFAQTLKAKGLIKNASYITGAEVRAITVLDISGNPLSDEGKLTSLKGIEYMTQLRQLVCKSNALTQLDLSKNRELEIVQVENNQLATLILPYDDELEILECGQNKLTSLDCSHLSDLRRLDCSENQLSALNISGCEDLTTLYVNDNRLTALDIAGAPALTAFGCENNPGAAGVMSIRSIYTNSTIPAGFTSGSWQYDGQTVSVVYSR